MRIECFGRPLVSAKWRTIAIVGWIGWVFQYFIHYVHN
jgi:hypothetical protein